MIKAAGSYDGQPMLLLGLSGENFTRLLADEPIRFNLAELGLPPMWVVIVGGRTEDAITQQLRDVGLIDSASVVQERTEGAGVDD